MPTTFNAFRIFEEKGGSTGRFVRLSKQKGGQIYLSILHARNPESTATFGHDPCGSPIDALLHGITLQIAYWRVLRAKLEFPPSKAVASARVRKTSPHE